MAHDAVDTKAGDRAGDARVPEVRGGDAHPFDNHVIVVPGEAVVDLSGPAGAKHDEIGTATRGGCHPAARGAQLLQAALRSAMGRAPEVVAEDRWLIDDAPHATAGSDSSRARIPIAIGVGDAMLARLRTARSTPLKAGIAPPSSEVSEDAAVGAVEGSPAPEARAQAVVRAARYESRVGSPPLLEAGGEGSVVLPDDAVILEGVSTGDAEQCELESGVALVAAVWRLVIHLFGLDGAPSFPPEGAACSAPAGDVIAHGATVDWSAIGTGGICVRLPPSACWSETAAAGFVEEAAAVAAGKSPRAPPAMETAADAAGNVIAMHSAATHRDAGGAGGGGGDDAVRPRRVTRHWLLPTVAVDMRGESYFGQRAVPMAEPSGANSIGALSAAVPATGVVFRETPPDYAFSWHNAPRPQFVVNLDARVKVEVSRRCAGAPTSREFARGECFIVEDTCGDGHFSTSVGERVRHSLFMPFRF